MNYRIEKDTMGEIRVPADRLWGAQTERSLQNFRIGIEKMPPALLYAFAQLKMACASVNHDLGQLEATKTESIVRACDEILGGKHDGEFPLSVWQTGSGTQTNMNCNEVIANRASQLLSGDLNDEKLIHPNDDVNMSQSSNDTFPTAMHIAAVVEVENTLLPAISHLHDTLAEKAEQYKDIVKIGRTHLMDATPLSLGQEISGWVAMLDSNRSQLQDTLEYVRGLAIGGTAVGTGINAHPEFGNRVAAKIMKYTGKRFFSASNKFQALTSHDALVTASGALKALAANLMKIANDVRWLASGPRCGIGELTIPANEPGSSIMPGKVNPTQVEAMTMVACQVFGNDSTIAFAASQGNFQLNVFKPVIIYNFLQSTTLLADTMRSFTDNCAVGIAPELEQIKENLMNSLMLVTALSPHIGYEKSAKIAKTAHTDNCSLKEAAMKLGLVSAEQFDRFIVPEEMISPSKK
jgi:fumarate hydratase, class II